MKMQKSIVIYEVENGQTHIEVQLDKDTLWLNLLQIAELFERDKPVISRHLKNIFDTGELNKNSVVAKSATLEAGDNIYRKIRGSSEIWRAKQLG